MNRSKVIRRTGDTVDADANVYHGASTLSRHYRTSSKYQQSFAIETSDSASQAAVNFRSYHSVGVLLSEHMDLVDRR
jgi:hypothetical protein